MKQIVYNSFLNLTQESQRMGKQKREHSQIKQNKKKHKKKIDRKNKVQDKNLHDPKLLIKRYEKIIQNIYDSEQSQVKGKEKATNIPKFLINIFIKNKPDFKDQAHNQRLKLFQESEKYSKTRFDLVELFGVSQDPIKNCQNTLNREAMLRLLNRNYSNILTNQHIRNKKAYLLYSKKIMLRLGQPQIIDRLQV